MELVVYAGRDGSWSERLREAKIFASEAEAEAGLLIAQNDVKRNLVVEPVVVEVVEDAGGLRAVTLREAIRALGPTIDFLPRALPRRKYGQASRDCGFANTAIGGHTSA